MFKLIYMKADYEPWWQFDGWQDHIVSTDLFETEEALEKALENKLKLFREKFSNEKTKGNQYYAFWSDEESEYCDACDEDIQIYHGIIIERK